MAVNRRELLAALLSTPMLVAAAADDLGRSELEPGERAEFLTDAEIAWRYFALLTDPRTGLLPASAWLSGKITSHPFVAMWDVGSMLLGLIGAHAIGIIENDEFERRTAAALSHIPDTDIGGLRLPRLIASVRGTTTGQDGFDASDAGRLLIALKILDTYAGGAFGADKIVARWDLAATLVGGRLHNVKNGELVDVHDTNYANYLVRGFAAWGFDVAPAYPIPREDGGADADMRLVSEVARRGPVGTEPHLLEEVELGFSNAARTIADVLAVAQERAYAATGKFYCVSEGALDREPWFTYQGFRFDAADDPWTVETIDNLAKYQTAEFRRAALLTSTKAAFLWAAARPNAYSRALLGYVRARARIPGLGYASGIYLETGEPTANYSDVNTNAVILEAIACILGGRTPLLNLKPMR